MCLVHGGPWRHVNKLWVSMTGGWPEIKSEITSVWCRLQGPPRSIHSIYPAGRSWDKTDKNTAGNRNTQLNGDVYFRDNGTERTRISKYDTLLSSQSVGHTWHTDPWENTGWTQPITTALYRTWKLGLETRPLYWNRELELGKRPLVIGIKNWKQLENSYWKSGY